MVLEEYSPGPWVMSFIRIQVEGVQGCDNEDQVAIASWQTLLALGSEYQLTLGTPSIKQIINMIKESEIDELSVSLNGLRIAQLLACWQAGLSIQKENWSQTKLWIQPDLNEVVKMTKKEEVNTFSSKIIHSQMKTLLLGNRSNICYNKLMQ